MQLKWRSPYEKYVKSTDCFPHPPLTSTSPSLSLSSAQHLQLVFDGRNVLNVGHALERGQRKKLSTHTHTQSHRNMNSVSVVEHNMDMEHTHTQWQTSLDLPPVLDFVLPRFCHLVNLQSACKAYAAYAQCAPKQRTNVCVCVCVFICVCVPCTLCSAQCFSVSLFFVFYFPFFFNIFARTCCRVCLCVCLQIQQF